METFIATIDIEPEPGNNAVENMQVRSFKVCLGRVFIAMCRVKYGSNGTELRIERYWHEMGDHIVPAS